MSGLITYLGKSNIVTNEGDSIMLPKMYRPNNALRGHMYIHGAGELSDSPIGQGPMQDLAKLYPTISMDLGQTAVTPGGTDGWSNAIVLSRISTGRTYLQGTLGAKTGKIFLSGVSMGAGGALCWAAHNPTLIAAVFVIIPAIGLTDIYTNNRSGLQSSINLAYGGTYSSTATDATYTPSSIQASRDVYYMGINSPSMFTSFPIIMWYGTADPTAIPANVTGFATSVNNAGGNVTIVADSGGTHLTTYWDLYYTGGTYSNMPAIYNMFAANA